MKLSRYALSLYLLVFAALACNMPQSGLATSPAENITPNNNPTSSITGTVWHDLCAAVEGPVPNPIPAGCVPSSGGGLIANGIIEAGEPGIAGILVNLHSDSCTDPITATATTDGNGGYTFNNLKPGSYCISIDANTSENSPILLPGNWTNPVSTGSLAELTGTLTEGTGLSDQNFGWDYQFLPAPANTPITATATTVSVPVPTGGPTFVVDTPANCRKGPSTSYLVVTSFPAGTTLLIQARNTNSTWWLVQADATTTCWISNGTGHTNGDTSGVAIIADPPTPTPVPGGDTIQPVLSGPIAVYTNLYYPTTNCGSNLFNVAIHATDDNLNAVWLSYRFVGSGGYVGLWNELTPNDNASGGLNGFNYDLNAQAAGELGGSDGEIQYRFFASDTAGNDASYPPSGKLSIPLQYCP